MKVKGLDLTKGFPESSRKIYGGLVHLARMRDKARAKGAGTIGEYIFPCPLDLRLLGVLVITPDAFYEAAQKYDDLELESWVKQNAFPRTLEEVKAWNEAFLGRKPDTPESLQYFQTTLQKVAPNRPDIESWVDLLDLEEGRTVPVRK